MTKLEINKEDIVELPQGGLESMQYSRSWSCSMGGWLMSAIVNELQKQSSPVFFTLCLERERQKPNWRERNTERQKCEMEERISFFSWRIKVEII